MNMCIERVNALAAKVHHPTGTYASSSGTGSPTVQTSDSEIPSPFYIPNNIVLIALEVQLSCKWSNEFAERVWARDVRQE